MNDCIRRSHHLKYFAAFASLMLVGAITKPALAGKPIPPPPPPVTYTISYIDPATTLWTMNEAGVAVGWTGAEPRAVMRLANGTLVDLTTVAATSDPNYLWSLLDYALEINEFGQIAGRGFRIENGVPAARLFRYSPAQNRLEAIRIGDPSNTLFVSGMNDFGDVVLHATTTGLETLPSNPGGADSVWVFSGEPGLGVAERLLTAAVPGAINNFGEVTGAVDLGTESKAFRYAFGQPLELFGTINGNASGRYQKSEGMDINDAGTIAGWARQGQVKGRENTSMRAVRLSDDGTWENLMGQTVENWAVAINGGGVSVGFGATSGTGFVHIGGKLYSIRDLIVSPPASLQKVYPRDITDGGQICGTVSLLNTDGTTSEAAVILTPTP